MFEHLSAYNLHVLKYIPVIVLRIFFIAWLWSEFILQIG